MMAQEMAVETIAATDIMQKNKEVILKSADSGIASFSWSEL